MKKVQWLLCFIVINICWLDAAAQEGGRRFSHQDTLRGSIGPGRMGWDVLKYDITIRPDYETKTLKGNNIITYFDNGVKLMQLDLQDPMILDSVTNNGKAINFTREGNVYWLQLRDPRAMYKIKPGKATLQAWFHGKPMEAANPPWDGGWIWKKDRQGNPWMTVACQGLGASCWYPCKDTQADEPDSGALLHIVVPDTLSGIGNGRLTGTTKNADHTTTWTWAVQSPINNYNIVPYIGKYSHFKEVYKGLKGPLNMDYWVLDSNVIKAKQQFKDAPRMMKAFEYWFGPYPFYKDGYKLVEAPHLGMEHQSAIAYGNGYRQGYFGQDLSKTGWGLKWDFIIVHESGHEWFGNNITAKDIADMWIHEGFTNYSETLFTDYYYGKAAGNEYNICARKNIENKTPVTGSYGVNNEGSIDMYYKVAAMLHSIRQLTVDAAFRSMLQGLNKTFYQQTVTASDIENYMSRKLKLDLSKVFEQYLMTTQVPVLEYKIEGYSIKYRYTNCVAGFNMPMKIMFKGTHLIKPTEQWQTLSFYPEGDTSFAADPNFYVEVKEVK